MSEPVYTVLVEDRHTDPEIKVFGNRKKAKAWVEGLLEMYLSNGSAPPSKAVHRASSDGVVEGWEFGESNRITLERKDLL